MSDVAGVFEALYDVAAFLKRCVLSDVENFFLSFFLCLSVVYVATFVKCHVMSDVEAGFGGVFLKRCLMLQPF